MKSRIKFLCAATALAAALCLPAGAGAESMSIEPGSFATAPSNLKAGAHADMETKYTFEAVEENPPYPRGGSPRDLHFQLPPGALGAANAAPTCPAANAFLYEVIFPAKACPRDTMLGEALLVVASSISGTITQRVLVYNIDPATDEPAAFGFNVFGFPVRIDTALRSDGDYGLNATIYDLTEAAGNTFTDLTFWGVPADHSGPGPQLASSERSYGGPNTEEGVKRLPFTVNPVRCDTPLSSSMFADPWQNAGARNPDGSFNLAGPNWATASYEIGTFGECEELEFEPRMKARPTTNAADSPSGLDVDLHFPQNNDPDGVATAQLRDAEVTLPEGLVVNPSSANGLGACTPAQIGMTSAVGDGHPHFNLKPSQCPDASRLGSVEVHTPLLDDPPLKGSIYLASPQQNPFGSLLSIYLVAEGHGILAKLAGKISADPQTGRLSAVFAENPQAPVEDVVLRFDAGAFAPLRTPSACGKYATTSVLTPWSSPETPIAGPRDEYEITQGPNGKPCGAAPNNPSFEAGSTAPLAGQYKPFVINLRREDGTQQFSSVTVSPPAGLVAKLAGTPTCSDAALAVAASKSGRAEQASPSCPAASQVGSIYAAAGAGPAPYNAPGKVYLTGPYKGAPLSLAVIAPAVAGPFDLGTIVVKNALRLDPKTAKVTAISDPIPTMLAGIPLDLRSLSIRLDKPGFALNPTSCDPTSVDGSLLSLAGATASLKSRFQLAECGQLKFKPSLSLSLKGGTKRGQYPALTAVLKPRAGDANIASVSVALPHSEFLAQNHIRTVCTRVQFAANACPPRSVYGKVSATTPLLDYPLTGLVYLRSSDNTLPDLALSLNGPASQPIHFEASGKTDSIDGGIRNTFDFVPDVPITKFTLQLQGQKKGLLENSRNICAATNKANVSYTAHNGSSYEIEPQLKVKCGAKAKHKGKGKRRHGAKHGG